MECVLTNIWLGCIIERENLILVKGIKAKGKTTKFRTSKCYDKKKYSCLMLHHGYKSKLKHIFTGKVRVMNNGRKSGYRGSDY